MVSVVDVAIELRHRIETFEPRIALQWWQVLDRRTYKAVLKRLHELQLVFNKRSAKSNSWRECCDAYERTSSPAAPWQNPLGFFIEFFRTRFCFYGRHCSAELSIFIRLGI